MLFSVLLFSSFVSATGNFDMVQCWADDGNQSNCEANASRGCVWKPKANNTWCTNATGCCNTLGCWTYDANQTGCQAAINSSGLNCEWKPNDQSQNPWCQNNAGCCNTVSCWSKDGTSQNACENTSFMGGVCQWKTSVEDTWCPSTNGCCNQNWCGSNWMQNSTKCNAAINLGWSCKWNTTNCTEPWMGSAETQSNITPGGCSAHINNSQGCTQTGWCSYDNLTGNCLDPYMTGSANYTDFNVHCWAFDNNPGVCKNVSGCIYCADGGATGNFSIGNPGSFCYKKETGWCEGHQEDNELSWNGSLALEYNWSLKAGADRVNLKYIANSTINCSDFNSTNSRLCDCGPLPGCHWDGSECRPGPSECTLPEPPIKYCDGTLSNGSKATQGMCTDLITKYFMNCAWNKETSECDFNWGSIGDVKNNTDKKDYYKITNEEDCVAAKGKWVEEAYCDGNTTKYENWCEMKTGIGSDNCDDSCAACDFFFPNGTVVDSAADASSACNSSVLGYCKYTTDSNAPNKFGLCAPPGDFLLGAGDCQANCKDCDLITNNASGQCNVSNAGCKWDTVANSCIGNTSLGCDVNCFSCYSTATCANSKSNCTWDPNLAFCKTISSSSEICFDGLDNDNDAKIDCGDGDCATDVFCGSGVGGIEGSGMGCGAQTTEVGCTGLAAGQTGKNCVWVTSTNSQSYCGAPGSNCFLYNNNKTGCNVTAGCNWTQTTGNFFINGCGVNWSHVDACSKLDNTSCEAQNCRLYMDPTTGHRWCNGGGGDVCMSLYNQTGCQVNSNCTWVSNNNGYSWCKSACYGLVNVTNDACDAFRPYCVLGNQSGGNAGTCQSTMFSEHGAGQKGCGNWDGNKTGCDTNNVSCMWDPNGVASGIGVNQGWCQQKGMMTMFSQLSSVVPDFNIVPNTINTSVPGEIDLTVVGVKETPMGFLFEVGVRNINNSAYCNGYSLPAATNIGGPQGDGTNTTQFFIYLDTDGITTNGCGAPIASGVNHSTKFDFLIQHVTTRSGITTEAKTLYKCSVDDNAWGPTNVFVSTKPSEGCRARQTGSNTDGVFAMMIEKESFEKFAEFKNTKTMRILVTAGDSNSSRSAPNETAGPGSYSPGSIGFKPVDCNSPSASKTDPKCSKLKTFGFIPKENCFTAIDDDSDGNVNCFDIDCKSEPKCASDGVNSAGSSLYWGNDVSAPQVLYSEVNVYPDSAFIKYFTDEPANGTVDFYSTDNNCTTLNKSIRDPGLYDPNLPAFRDWHEGPIDNFASNAEKIDFKLTNGTTYHYKLTVCNPVHLCAVSSCLNFTTAKTSTKKDCPSCNVIFKMTPPSGMKAFFDFGGGDYSEQQGNACGFKVNYTQAKKAKIKFETGNLSIELINVSVSGKLSDNAKSFNESELHANTSITTSDGFTTGCIGFSKDKFEMLKSGGIMPEKIKVKMPKGTAGCSKLTQCNDCTSSSSCTDITNDTGVALINDTEGYCEWMLPAQYNYI